MVACAVEVAALFQGLRQGCRDTVVRQAGKRLVDALGEPSGSGYHQRPARLVGLFAGTYHAFRRQAKQPADLCDDARGELADPLQGEQLAAGLDHHGQAAAIGIDGVDLFVGTDGCGQDGVQAVAGQFGLGLVVVDVVIADGVHFRCVAGLAGAQDDAHFAVVQLFADTLDQLQAGLLGLHDHVQQDHRDLGFVIQELQCLVCRVGMQELQRAAEYLGLGQGQAGRLVDIAVIVDDQDAPAGMCRVGGLARVFLIEGKQIVIAVLAHRLALTAKGDGIVVMVTAVACCV